MGCGSSKKIKTNENNKNEEEIKKKEEEVKNETKETQGEQKIFHQKN